MSNIAIRVENLGKMYRIGAREKQAQNLRERIQNMALAPFDYLRRSLREPTEEEILWALKDVSFEVKKGEVIGIIGRNGAGKSTLLKILSRITEPTEGQAEMFGRISSLLEVGTGFHHELTGRENVYLNGTILGMTKAEVDRKFDEIVDFSGVEKFIDTPVKRYSSGMKVRLAFSVAAHLEPEILLIDEVLAVGDAEFQKKCLGKMEDVAGEGRTVLFVSHNMAAISSLCPKAILIDRGSILANGFAEDVIDVYLSSSNSSNRTEISLANRLDRKGNGKIRFTNVTFLNSDGDIFDSLRVGQDVTIALDYKTDVQQYLGHVSISIPFYNLNNQHMFMCWTDLTGDNFSRLPCEGRILCDIPEIPLSPGMYYFNVWCEAEYHLADWVKQAGKVQIVEGDFFGTGKLPPRKHGGLVVHHNWRLEEDE